MQCSICGEERFSTKNVLWDKLINDWQLSKNEVSYINRQQGKTCNGCGANIRSIALANSIRSLIDTSLLLSEIPHLDNVTSLSILEINEAGSLTNTLKTLGDYTFAEYPEVDMHCLPYDEATFDMVVHSDTVEHINNPVHALAECHRVLKIGGGLCFTIPVIVGRMSRNRDGLSMSYHGNSDNLAEDYVVHTEFGADAWTYIIKAGFSDVSIHTFEYPAGIAFLARRTNA